MQNVRTRKLKHLISPHHGTHYHDSIAANTYDQVVTSVGDQLYSKLRSEYSSDPAFVKHHVTHDDDEYTS